METFEDVKKICAEAGIEIEIYPGQLIHPLTGMPYWAVKNWNELVNALKHCTVPRIGSVSMSFRKDGPADVTVEIYDDFIWRNKDYRWTVGAGEKKITFLPIQKTIDIHYVSYNDAGDLEVIQPCKNCPIVDPTPANCAQCSRESEEMLL